MKKVNIDNFNSEKKKFYVLAETGFSHKGDIDYLIKQIESAYKGKADGIKLQLLLNKEDSYCNTMPNYEQLDQWILNKDEWKEIINYIKQNTTLDIIVLPIDDEAAKFCMDNEVYIDGIELHSINLNQIYILETIKNFNKNIILGVGGRTVEEIYYCLDSIQPKLIDRMILMHGFQAFPTDWKDLKLARIKEYKDMFKCIMGYADHSSYNDPLKNNIIEYAYINGARVFELHLVLKKGEPRIDYESAVEYMDLLEIRNRLEKVVIIQDNKKALNFSKTEIQYRNRQKKIVALQDIKQDERITKYNIGYKVTMELSGLEQKDYINIIGKKAIRDISKDSIIKLIDLL